MTHRRKSGSPQLTHLGFSLIEVLVTIIILMIGLLGLAGLQARALTSQMESYQRSQALILLKDMADRIDANRINAASYVTSGLATPYLGTDNALAACPASSVQAKDSCEWNNALLGAAEAQTTGGAPVGAMLGARGCVFQLQAPASGIPSVYQVVVSWQGLNSTAIPDSTTPTSVFQTSAGRCALNKYTDKNGPNEALHRVISMPISIADLN
ncbi:MAG: type IV pilus modification protein PilV [Nitrosomonadales bacterium]|nr:type IV pilus modification protein PilV [Nitrosomonadales bacterium]